MRPTFLRLVCAIAAMVLTTATVRSQVINGTEGSLEPSGGGTPVSSLLSGQITMTISATGTGIIGSTNFNGPFTITGVGDVANRTMPAANVLDIPFNQATIFIQGVGTATFTLATRVFSNNGGIAGFSRGGPAGLDILNIDGFGFTTWDMTTSIGPIFDAGLEPIGQATGLGTTLGTLNFTGYSNGTFNAVVVPEPAFSLFASGVLLGLRVRRRNPWNPAPARDRIR